MQVRNSTFVLFALLALSLPVRGVDPPGVDLAPRQTIEARLRHFSNNNSEREGILKQMFADSGCAPPSLAEQPVARELPNVVCTLAGATQEEIIVGAHFDHVAVGQGVVDNWSGASMLPDLYASLRNHHHKHTFVFIGFTSEEQGLVGSKFYASHLSPADRARVRAMVNIDSVGLASTKVFLRHSDKELFDKLVALAAAMQMPVAVVNPRNANDDSEPFKKRGIPTLVVHSVTPQTWPILHSPRDTLAPIHLDDYYATYRLVAAYLAYLDEQLQ